VETELRVTSERSGRLAIMDSYYPGWRAWLNGIETRIYLSNQAFQAVDVPAGDHLVRLRYEPVDFKIGFWFSLASLVTFCLVFILFLTRLSGRCPFGNKRHSS